MRFFSPHLLVITIFCFIAYFSFSDGSIVFGDFATSFNYNHSYYLTNFMYSWLDNSFLGYETSFYTFIRLPYYILVDLVTYFNVYENYWLVIFFIYSIRYLIFYFFLRNLNVPRLLSVLVSFIYAINFFYLDRLGHIYISFASTTIPTLILAYRKMVCFGIDKKNLILYILSLWVIFSSMHVTLLTLYFMVILFTYQLLIAVSRDRTFHFLRTNCFILILSIIPFLYFLVPILYSKYILRTENLVEIVSLKTGDWIFNLSLETHFYNTIIGSGFIYSEILKNQFLIWLGLFSVIPLYFYILLLKKEKTTGDFFFYLTVFLIFLFLSTFNLSNAFIPDLKRFLIGFSSIKDSSYFLLYVQFSFWTLVAISINNFSKDKFFKIFSSAHLLVISVIFLYINYYAFNNFEVFQKSQIPNEYPEVFKHLDKNGKILILPLGWVSEFEWSGGIMSGFFNLYLAEYKIIGQNIIEGPSLMTQDKLSSFNNCFKENCEDLPNFLKELGTVQLVEFYTSSSLLNKGMYLGKSKHPITIDYLLKKGYIYKTYGNSSFSIYSITPQLGVAPEIHSDKLYLYQVNPIKKVLKIRNVFNKQEIVFRNSFHPEWKLYLKPINNNGFECNVLREYSFEGKNVKECNHEQAFYEGEELGYIYEKPVFEDTHSVVYDYANKWVIDPDYIKSNFDQNYYRKNDDGSIDIELVLYYRPQSYFYLGIIISSLSLGVFICYLIFDFFKNRNKKNTQPIEKQFIGK